MLRYLYKCFCFLVAIMLPCGAVQARAVFGDQVGDVFFKGSSLMGHRLALLLPHKLQRPKSNSSCKVSKDMVALAQKYDHALKRYLHIKTRTLLEENVDRIKDGHGLSHYYPDYRDYSLFIRRSGQRDRRVNDYMIQKNFYIWKEGQKLIMSPHVMLMGHVQKEQVFNRLAINSRTGFALADYRAVAAKTRKAALSTTFTLDCSHAAELDGLAHKVLVDLMAGDDRHFVTPHLFDDLLTVLRGYISYNYYKDLSHRDFERRFKDLVRKTGNVRWTHKKLSRLLGLHVMGRIEKRYKFRKTYARAISQAVRRYPNVPRQWVEQIIWIESGGDPKAISRAGAFGLMQIMPFVFMGLGEEKARQYPLAFARTINPFNARMNILRGTAFLDRLQKMLAPHMRGFGLAMRKQVIFHAYNGGVTRVIRLLKKHGSGYKRYLPGETRAYLGQLYDFPRNNKKRRRAGDSW